MIRFVRLALTVALLNLALLGTASTVSAEEPSGATPAPAERPPVLVPLYASFAALQVADMYSTWRALDQGAVEVNPVMSGVVGNKAGLIAAKAGGAAAVIGVTERLWRKNRTAAILFMISVNSAMTWVVQHNYRAVP
jgi:hypothetical protein